MRASTEVIQSRLDAYRVHPGTYDVEGCWIQVRKASAVIVDPAVVVMKVGSHAQEELRAIVRRKRDELNQTGRTWWGYGGSACNPLKQVQPFSRDNRTSVSVVFLPTRSRPQNRATPAAHWSADGVSWSPVPKGISVTGSKYALVLSDLVEVNDSIDLAHYCVGIGPSEGRLANQYLRFQCDKACVRRARITEDSDIRQVVLYGRLASPWAVLLS
jgi:hypothetical protein